MTEWYSPDRKPPPPQQPLPPDLVLWTITVNGIEWRAELCWYDRYRFGVVTRPASSLMHWSQTEAFFVSTI
jgi:hypothetical protein